MFGDESCVGWRLFNAHGDQAPAHEHHHWSHFDWCTSTLHIKAQSLFESQDNRKWLGSLEAALFSIATTIVSPDMTSPFIVGELVQVDRRAWPGINQPGGVGHIVQVDSRPPPFDDSKSETGARPSHEVKVSVRYVLDGRLERNIDTAYVHAHNQSSSRSLRDRRMLLGRCSNCGSLRRDCGSCDMWSTPLNTVQEASNRLSHHQAPPSTTTEKEAPRVEQEKDEDEDSIDAMLDEIKAFKPKRTKVRNLQKKAKQLLFGGNDVYDNDHLHKSNFTTENVENIAGAGDSGENHHTRSRENVLVSHDLSPDSPHGSLSSEGEDDDDDSVFLQELITSQKQLVVPSIHNPSTLTDQSKRKRVSHGHVTSILERIGSPQQPSALSHSAHVERTSEQGKDAKTPRISFSTVDATPTSVCSFASRDTKDSEPNRSESNQSARFPSHIGESQSPLNPSQADLVYEEYPYEGNHDDEANDFIQPEGDAEEMPRDIVDQTKSISFLELPAFFDRLAQDMETRTIPSARQELANMTASIQPETSLRQIEKAEASYNRLLGELVRYGRDQCQNVLRKLSNRHEYRKHKAEMPASQLSQFRGTKLEAREMRFQELDRTIESILAEFRHHIRLLEDQAQDEEEMRHQRHGSVDNPEEDEFSSNNSIPENDSDSTIHALRTMSPNRRSLDDPRTLSAFDRHQHARFKRPKRCTIVVDSNSSTKASKQTRKDKRKRRRSGGYGSEEYCLVVGNKQSNAGRQELHDERDNAHQADGPSSDDGGNSSMTQLEKETRQDNRSSVVISRSDSNEATFARNRQSVRQNNVAILGSSTHPLESGASLTRSRPSEQNQDNSMPHFAFGRGNGTYQERSSSRDQRATKRRSTERSNNTESRAIAAMEQFLRINSEQEPQGGGTVNFSRSSHQPNAGQVRSSRSVHGSKQNEFSSVQEASTRTRSATMFSLLRNRDRLSRDASVTTSRTAPLSDDNISSICANIAEGYQTQLDCSTSLDRLIDTLNSDSDIEPQNRILIWRTLLGSLRSEKGRKTIQEMLAEGQTDELSVHVKLLVATLSLMLKVKERSQSLIDKSASNIFNPCASAFFLGMVVHQFVEAILSLLFPSAWGLREIPDWAKHMKDMNTLLSALSLHENMIERTCQCILEELQIQQWRVASDGDHVYLSGVDSAVWSAFLDDMTTVKVLKPTTTRYSCIGQNLPRCEVDAIWGVLAFVVSSEQKASTNGVSMWQLLADILLRGTLVHSDSDMPPSPLQVQECQWEINHLSDLVPKLQGVSYKDSFLTNVVKRCALIGTYLEQQMSLLPEVVQHGINSSFEKVSGRIKKMFVLDDSMASASGITGMNGNVASGLMIPPGEHPVEVTFLLPSSGIHRQCLALFCEWIGRLPPKKVRINSFMKKTKIKWTEEIEAWLNNERATKSEQDSFQEAFSPSLGYEVSKTRTRLSEFAAFFDVLSFVCIAVRTDFALPKPQGKELAKNIWGLLSDRRMREHFHVVSSKSNEQCDCKVDTFLVQTAAKVVAFLVLCIAGINPMDPFCRLGRGQLLEHSSLESSLDFLAVALVTCLDCCSHSWEAICFVSGCLGTTVMYLKRLAHSTESEDWQVKGASLFLRCCWDKFLPVFCRCFGSTGPENHSSSMEHAISLLLSILYGLVPDSLGSTTSPPLIQNSPPKTDTGNEDGMEFGLDDSVLVQILDSCETKISQVHVVSLANLLWETFEHSKPSTRFDIGSGMSSARGVAVSRKSSLVCLSLAKLTLLCCDEAVADLILGQLNVQKIQGHKPEDKMYFEQSCFVYLSELLRRNRPLSFVHLEKHMESIALGVISMSLETGLIRKLPSLSLALNSVFDMNGRGPQCNEYFRLKAFTSGKLPALQQRYIEYREVCQGLLFRLQELKSSPGVTSLYESRCLEELDNDLTKKPVSLRPSMEGAMFDRLRLLRGVICQTSSTRNPEDFHRLSILLSQSSWELLCLCESLGNMVNVGENRLKETLRCYSVFYAAFTSWFILRATTDPITSPGFRKTLHEHYLSSLLRCSRSCPNGVLRRLATTTFTDGKLDIKSNDPTYEQVHDVLDLPLIMTGRCRQIIFCCAIEFSRGEFFRSSSSSFQALVNLCHEDNVARSVAHTLSGHREDPMDESMGSSFSRIVESYMRLIDVEKLSHGNGIKQGLDGLKRHTFEEILVRRLSRPRLRGLERLASLHLLRYMLEEDDSDNSVNDSSSTEYGLKVTCALFRSLSTTLMSILSEPKLHVEALYTALVCVRSCVCLPSRRVERNGKGWILDWCLSRSAQVDQETFDGSAYRYIMVTSRYFKRLSNLLRDRHDLNDYRRGLHHKRWEDQRLLFGWDDLDSEAKALEETIGLVSGTTSTSLQVNVYSKTAPSENVDFPEFVPSEQTERLAQMIVSEIIRGLPVER